MKNQQDDNVLGLLAPILQKNMLPRKLGVYKKKNIEKLNLK